MRALMIGFVFLMTGVLGLGGCDSVKTGARDEVSGAKIDSFKMAFKDTGVLILWGVPYARFTLELRVKTGADGVKRTDAVVTCKNVSDAPLKVTVDGVERDWPGHFLASETEGYEMSAEDLRACAYAKKLSVRVYHGADKHEDADVGADRIAGIRKLYERSFGAGG